MSEPGEILYEVRNLSKRYGAVVALDDVSMCVRAGEVVGLVGDNGAGKSTLVKCLSGAHQPSSGQVLLEGVERHWHSPHDAIEAGVETLYQDSGLAPHLSVSANVFLGREEGTRGSRARGNRRTRVGSFGLAALRWSASGGGYRPGSRVG